MKKKVIVLIPLLAVLIACFIPVTEEETLTIKTSFFNLYHVLATPAKWKEWRPDLRKIPSADTSKIAIKKDSGSFSVNYPGIELNVKVRDGVFDVDDHSGNGSLSYTYLPAPTKARDTTVITVDRKTTAVSYLLHHLTAATFKDTHIYDLKTFMQTDSLKYGCNIFKTHAPDVNLIVITKVVPTKDLFIQAAAELAQLQQFAQKHQLKQTQPIIAQFLPRLKADSTQVKVGLFVNKETVSDHDVIFTRMPKGGPQYAARFSGRFNRRQKIYTGLQQYFTDHLYQQAILPFELYLDNKLPTSDTSHVNIQVNFSTYF